MTRVDTEGECGFCDTEWVHVFERDTEAGAVFQPSGADIPLSRRPRERLLMKRNGSAVIRVGRPDDRLGDRAAQWSREGDAIVVRTTDDSTSWRIVEHQHDRLLVRMD